jgi:hypothetical protein
MSFWKLGDPGGIFGEYEKAELSNKTRTTGGSNQARCYETIVVLP